MTQPSYSRLPQSVDSRRGDTQRLMAQDLNAITRGYIWAWELLQPQTTADEWLHLHTVAAPFSIPADWGPMVTGGQQRYSGLEWFFYDMPSAETTWVIFKHVRVDNVFEQIGTWTFGTDASFTALTTDNKQIDFSRSDTFLVQAATAVEADLGRATFTIFGK